MINDRCKSDSERAKSISHVLVFCAMSAVVFFLYIMFFFFPAVRLKIFNTRKNRFDSVVMN